MSPSETVTTPNSSGGFKTYPRVSLPKPTDRLPLGNSGLQVSPFAIGITTPETVIAAYEMGINFFFVTSDLHWPLYSGIREGLIELFKNPEIRDNVVVAAVSYLEMPLFGALQYHEVIDVIPGLNRVDIMMAGAVPDANALYSRYNSLQQARAQLAHGARAIGASFHDRPAALSSINNDLMDINFIRYNTAHPGAVTDIFPHVKADRTGLIFNFKSTMSCASSEQMDQLGLNDQHWRPHITDYYRYALGPPDMDGILFSPQSPKELEEIIAALEKGPLSADEENYIRWLSTTVNATYF